MKDFSVMRKSVAAVGLVLLLAACGGGSGDSGAPGKNSEATACDQVKDIRAKVHRARNDLAAGKIKVDEALEVAGNEMGRVAAVASALPPGQLRSDIEAWGNEWAMGTERPEYRAAEAKVYSACGITREP